MTETYYPNEDLIIEYNALAIAMFGVKKAAKVEVLSHEKLSLALGRCRAED